MIENRSKALSEVRRLSPLDAAVYRNLCLAGLEAHPEAFGISWEEEAAHPLAWFEDRPDRHVIFGAEQTAAVTPRGVLGFYVPNGAKQQHKGVLWGMFIHSEARRTERWCTCRV